MIFYLCTALLLFILLVIIIGFSLSEKGYQGPISDHFDGKKFLNPDGLPAQNFPAVLKYGLTRKPEPYTENYETYVRTEAMPPPPTLGTKITFVNHATFLIQANGKNILTDPVWSKRCSPFQWAGPKRMRPPGLAFEALPQIDLILLSHNHYDHLDLDTLYRLREKYDPQIIVPLGVKNMLSKRGFTKVAEMDWWDTKSIMGFEIQSTPTNHFSARGMFDRDKTLWCGYLLKYQGFKTYFLGDSGYGQIFKTINERCGPMDLSLIPIGAYKPRWFMSPIHVSPEEAVQVHLDVQSKQTIAMHFGTFPLADDGQGTAEKEFAIALKEKGVDSKSFMVPEEGMTYSFGT